MEREHKEKVLFLLGQMLKTKPEDSVAADNQDEILKEKQTPKRRNSTSVTPSRAAAGQGQGV